MDNDLKEALKDLAFSHEVIRVQTELIEQQEAQIRMLKRINSLSLKNQEN